MTDKQDLVPVYTVKNANQAEIIKNFLESEGIFCSIEGEGQVGLAGILDIKLLVRADDADQARELIMQQEQEAEESEGEDEDEDDGEGEYGEAVE
jgi:hypothetical protein